jgi:hypothetical protein
MSASLQTIIALVLVALAVAYLAWSFLRKRRRPGCGGEDCGAVSPEIRRFQEKLKNR